MAAETIFGPFFAMIALTMLVWVVMYVRRLRFIAVNRIDPQQLTTLEKAASLIPEAVNWPAHNLRNLFEVPVLFYALDLYLFVTDTVDGVNVTGAWLYVGLRAVHSLVHCTINIVRLRFVVYFLSTIVLWMLLARAAWVWLQTN
ncbi:MAG: MAPEG family protein [Gammaproteobacteria bacterium]|nr:MAPEG family protein [Gammaproteobacteria bacterium]MDH5302562.1 MAPEG family protein [Gammaproteobacteria bacterium]MDH5321041.1 MAPEG family protein [Gammaproteobacteria bacterium]